MSRTTPHDFDRERPIRFDPYMRGGIDRHAVEPHRRERLRRAPRHPVARAAAVLLVAVLTGCGLADPGNPYAGRDVTTPVAVTGGRSFTQVSAGFLHTCALDTDGAAWCWGSDEYRQLGTSEATATCEAVRCARAPRRAGGDGRYAAIAAGVSHTCALGSAGVAWCWGGGYPGDPPLLGDGATRSSGAPVRVASDSAFVQLAVGATHACALTGSGRAFCWGRNEAGQLGDGSRQPRGVPVAVQTNERFARIAAGFLHACGVTVAGELLCWGANRWGQLGTGDVPYNAVGLDADRPARVAGTRRWRDVAAGDAHSCGLADDANVYCWGRNENARQLGDNSLVTHRGVPGPVLPRRVVEALAAGAESACARLAAGELWCWGSNYFGGLGNGRSVPAGEPVPQRTLLGPWRSVSLGGSHGCGISLAGVTYCWGDAFFGQVGHR
jgi:alpha-tubulin suppressor-like RCC1 family protein